VTGNRNGVTGDGVFDRQAMNLLREIFNKERDGNFRLPGRKAGNGPAAAVPAWTM